MSSFREALEQGALDLAWSLWTEVGVQGVQRRHAYHAIEIEPLVVFTAAIGDLDARLRDESIDWCMAYGRLVSKSLLKRLVSDELPEAQSAFGRYAATVNAQSALRWPMAAQAIPHKSSQRSRLEDLQRPSLIALRIRALLGTSARAEIVKAMLAEPRAWLVASQLSSSVGYTKRNLADALDALRMAGLVEVKRQRNALGYRLRLRSQLEALLGALPTYFPRWRSILTVIWKLTMLSSAVEDLEPIVKAVEAKRYLGEVRPHLENLSVAEPKVQTQGEVYWLIFEEWAIRLVNGWSSGDAGAFQPRGA